MWECDGVCVCVCVGVGVWVGDVMWGVLGYVLMSVDDVMGCV